MNGKCSDLFAQVAVHDLAPRYDGKIPGLFNHRIESSHRVDPLDISATDPA